jgi:hypothetical protein
MRTLTLLALLAAFTLLVPGEEKPVLETTKAPKKEPFIIYRITEACPVKLVDDFGVMLINTGGEENPSPKFIVGMRQSRTLIETSDPKVAEGALKLIPKGSKIRWYDSCTVPRSYGLPRATRQGFIKAMKTAGLVLLRDEDITCYCEKLP